MKKPFIILAMPRSMTAWTSCFLTIGNVFCQHEILRKDRHTDIAVQSILGQPYKYSGAACPGSLIMWDELVRRMPEANYIYIRRSPEQSLTSLARVAGVPVDMMEEGYAMLNQKAREFMQVAEPKVMDFAELATMKGMRKLWNWVCPEEHLPDQHLVKMHSLHIEQRREIIHAQVLGK